jgi:2-polyprenyl-3-methyl-5-hydroxy-6-metoxy-1,4-benzoquinol methylase
VRLYLENHEVLAVKSNEWDKRYEEREFVWSIEPNRFVEAELRDVPPGQGLDLASGEGRNALWLAERGWQVTAVDFSAVGMEKARRRAKVKGLDVNWVLEDVLHFEPEPESFDLVLWSYLHLPEHERRAVLAKACKAVAPGGTLLFVAHDLSNLEHGHGGPQSKQVLCTPEDVVADLHGFDIIKAEVVAREVEEDGAVVGIALDTLVRGRKPTMGSSA